MAGDGQDVQGAGLRIPPDWVPFLQIPQCVEDRFGIQITTEWLQDLWSLVRKNSPIIVYRVAGMRVSDFPTRAFQFGTLSSAGFPGLQPSQQGSGHITVADWDEAGFDPEAFTVMGPERGGSRGRKLIEIKWTSVEKWVRDRLEVAKSDKKDNGVASTLGYSKSDYDHARATAWMLGYATAFIDRSDGQKPTRDETLQLCCQKIGVTNRIARNGWDALPEAMKNPPRTAR